MFYKQNKNGYLTLAEGVGQKTLVYGEKSSLSEFVVDAGSLIPQHSHPHEQSGYLVRGHLRFSATGEIQDVYPGDAWCFPGGVEHGAEVIEDSVVVEVFTPVREEYLPKKDR
ncbi:cupin domain-containing protein [Thermodesulfobacteriota bacterium]